MSSYKRKRISHAPRDFAVVPYKGAAVYKRRRTTAPPFRRGRDRVGGYYGRFAGANAEMKFHDVDLDDAIIAAGGVITPTINIIPQDVTEIGRIGRKCTIKSIFWRGNLAIPTGELQGAPGQGERFRIILYLDKQCNGATATALGILEVVGIDGYRNLANSGRFQILFDHRAVLNYQTLSHFAVNSFAFSAVQRNFSFFKKCTIPIEFDSTTGALTEVRSNNLGILIISEGGTGSIASSIRLRFSDQG